MSEGKERQGTRNILITGRAKNNRFHNIVSRNADVHIEIDGDEAEGNTFDGVDMRNSPEWEERRRRARDNSVKVFIVGVASSVAAAGIAYALGWV